MLTGSLASAYYAVPRATQDLDLVIEAEQKVFVNDSGEGVALRVWAIAQGVAGAMGVGSLSAPKDSSPPVLGSTLLERVAIEPVGKLLVLQVTIDKKETLHVVPGTGGSVSIRVETVG